MKNVKQLGLCFFLITISVSTLFAKSAINIVKSYDETTLLIKTKIAGITDDNFGIKIELSGKGAFSVLNNNNKKKDFVFDTENKVETIYIYSSLVGFLPSHIIFKNNSDFVVFAAKLIVADQSQPLIADIGHIIFSDFKPLKDDWNIYRWNVDPDILIFDTKDYATQASLFKRLAFFVEKEGYVGTLLSNEDLKGKHGWNAHDYKPADIADFFNAVDESGFILSEKELKLKDIFLKEGIIVREDSAYKAGVGAVLSVSRESLQNWRYRFLTHECLHGLFFINDNLKRAVVDDFYSMESMEIDFWNLMLEFRNYDINNTNLIANEYFAYCLQQPVDDINNYLKLFIYKSIIKSKPYENEFIDRFDKSFPDSFSRSAKRLEAILFKYYGSRAGKLANIWPAFVNDSFYVFFK